MQLKYDLASVKERILPGVGLRYVIVSVQVCRRRTVVSLFFPSRGNHALPNTKILGLGLPRETWKNSRVNDISTGSCLLVLFPFRKGFT